MGEGERSVGTWNEERKEIRGEGAEKRGGDADYTHTHAAEEELMRKRGKTR